MKTHRLIRTSIDTPLVGQMVTVAAIPLPGQSAAAEGLTLLDYTDWKNLPKELEQVARAFGTTPAAIETEDNHPIFNLLREELDAYFSRKLKEPFTVPLLPVGTEFQKRVWNALLEVPYGTTRSYAEQTRAVMQNDPDAGLYVRAVASANGKNKLPILIPCHRVIGSNRALTGYSGGLHRKQALLELEQQSGTQKLPGF